MEAPVVGVMPKSVTNPYFIECRRGAEEAAAEQGLELQWEGPADNDTRHQLRVIEEWIGQRLPVIAVSVEDSDRLSPALARARNEGIGVLTWDADADAAARDFAIVSATPESIAHALSVEVGRILGGRGTLAAITSTLTAPNQRAWLAEFRKRLKSDYPEIELAEVKACRDDPSTARDQVLELLKEVPGIQGIVGFCSPAVPATARALRDAGRRDVRVTGVSLPSLCSEEIEAGGVDSVVTWKAQNLGYLVAASAHALATGVLRPGATSLRAGRLGTVVVLRDEIRLGRCHIVTKGNLAEYVAYPGRLVSTRPLDS